MVHPSRFPLAHHPRPYEAAPRLAAALGLGRLHVKREDLAGPALGGTMIRSLELILGAARAAGADTVLATGTSQSESCRALAGSAPLAGLSCHLLLRGSGDGPPAGNLLLMKLFGATMAWTAETDPWSPVIRARLEAEATTLRAAGRRPYILHRAGDTAALAAAAWALAAEELAADFDAAGTAPDLLAMACGSGLTLAGLALGFARLGLPVPLLGISIREPAARLRPWVEDVAGRAATLLGWDEPYAMEAVTITDEQLGPGPGVPSPAGLAAMTLAARHAGLVLDPCRGGKAMAGLAAAVGKLVPAGGAAAFLHSGGMPGLFTHGEAVAAALG